MTKWILSSLSVLLFVVILFINVGNNSEFNDEFNTNLSNVSNDEMEAVILENPDIHPMRMALANRYFDEVNYSEALPHYMYIAENSADSELKSFALAQIGWMVFESIKINSDSLVAKSYLGIIYIQDPETKADGIEILNSVIKSDKLSKDDKIFISEILENYEK